MKNSTMSKDQNISISSSPSLGKSAEMSKSIEPLKIKKNNQKVLENLPFKGSLLHEKNNRF